MNNLDKHIKENSFLGLFSLKISNLSSKYQAPTRMEIQVAELVKEGKTTKDLAVLLERLNRAIEFYRHSL